MKNIETFDPSEWEKTFKCVKCGTKFVAEIGDIFHYAEQVWAWPRKIYEHWVYLICPGCGGKIYFSEWAAAHDLIIPKDVVRSIIEGKTF